MKKFIIYFVCAFMINVVWGEEDEKDKLSNSPLPLDRVDLAAYELVVNDKYYKMDLNIKVYDNKGNPLNRKALKKGQKVTLKLSPYRAAGYEQVESIVIH